MIFFHLFLGQYVNSSLYRQPANQANRQTATKQQRDLKTTESFQGPFEARPLPDLSILHQCMDFFEQVNYVINCFFFMPQAGYVINCSSRTEQT